MAGGLKATTVKRLGVGDDTQYDNLDLQDEADAISLYETLENEIVPLYYTKRSAMGCLAIGSSASRRAFALFRLLSQ